MKICEGEAGALRMNDNVQEAETLRHMVFSVIKKCVI